MKYEMRVNTTRYPLNVRSGPSLANKVVGSLKKGTTVICTESKNGWYKHNKGGWSSADYLVMVKNLDTTSTGTTKKVTKEAAKIPDTPLTDYEKSIVNSLYNYADINNTEVDEMRYILGLPFQFTATTDPRLANTQMGGIFAENMVETMSTVTIIPGKAAYMADFSNKASNDMLNAMFNKQRNEEGNGDEKKRVADLISDDKTGRYYSFRSDYTEYMKYVNNMCRLAAIYLDIGDLCYFDGAKPYRLFDWSITNLNGRSSIYQYLSKGEPSITFCVDSNSTTFSESVSNSTEQSTIASTFSKTGGDFVKEAQFLLGKSFLDESVINTSKNNYETAVQKLVSTISKNNTLIDQFSDMASSSAYNIVNGANIIFPEIYKESSYSKSYDLDFKLISPYGDKESIYLNILVPLFHIMAFSFPRQFGGNGYTNPFLVRAFSKGWFNCSMGIVDQVSIKKSAQGGWSDDGLPTEVDVSVSIKDLYSSLSLSRAGDISTFKNIEFLDTLATWCGVNINAPENARLLQMYKSFLQGKVTETIPNIIKATRESISGKLYKFFIPNY